MPSSLPPLAPLHAAIFTALCAGDSDDAIAARLSLAPPDFYLALSHPDLQRYAQFRRESAAQRKADRATDALDRLLTTTADPIERRRAATTLLRSFREPPRSRPSAPRWPGQRAPAGAPAQPPSPQDLAAATATARSAIAALRRSDLPRSAGLHVLYSAMSASMRQACGGFAGLLERPGSLSPLLEHDRVEFDDAKWDDHDRLAVVAVRVYAPERANFEFCLTRAGDTWEINVIDRYPVRADTS